LYYRQRILKELGVNPNRLPATNNKYRYNMLILDISNVSYLDAKGVFLKGEQDLCHFLVIGALKPFLDRN
jgi:hypothetical protein